MLSHQKFGHANHAMLIHIHAYNTTKGIGLESHSLPSRLCEGCAIGKSVGHPFPKTRSSPQAKKAGLFFHANICRPMNYESFSKSRYFVLFKDDYFGYQIVYYVYNKSNIFEKFEALYSLTLQYIGNRIKKLCTDCGGKFLSNEFVQFLENSRICLELTNPHTPKHNKSTKCENRTLVE